MKEIYGDRCTVFEIDKNPIRTLKNVFNSFGGHIDGLSTELVTKIIEQIHRNNVNQIFVDGSNFGEFVRVIKQKLPEIQIFTFFHNVESRFFQGLWRQSRTFKSLVVLLVNFLAERKAVRYSDYIICLSERDSKLLNRIYNRAANHISPIALEDKYPEAPAHRLPRKFEKYALFVGGAFYGNQAGLSWFVEHIVPHLNISTYIVGKGLENMKSELERNGKVAVVGEVESVAQWYLDAHVVIAPIFTGSGMKTKVGEALMFGKKIIGTPEAFSGYEDIADKAGRICTTDKEFIEAMNASDAIVMKPFDEAIRAIYLERYSYEAAKLRFEKVLDP